MTCARSGDAVAVVVLLLAEVLVDMVGNVGEFESREGGEVGGILFPPDELDGSIVGSAIMLCCLVRGLQHE